MKLSVMGTAIVNMLLATVVGIIIVGIVGEPTKDLYYQCFCCGLLGAYSYDLHKLHKEVDRLEGGI